MVSGVTAIFATSAAVVREVGSLIKASDRTVPPLFVGAAVTGLTTGAGVGVTAGGVVGGLTAGVVGVVTGLTAGAAVTGLATGAGVVGAAVTVGRVP
jgi:uncharacterized membrane protein